MSTPMSISPVWAPATTPSTVRVDASPRCRRRPHRARHRPGAHYQCQALTTAQTGTPTPLFGTDGVRGDGRQYPLDHATVRRLGAALVRALPHGTESPRLLVGRDTRESGGWIEAELAHGASGEGRERHERRRRADARRRVPDAGRAATTPAW